MKKASKKSNAKRPAKVHAKSTHKQNHNSGVNAALRIVGMGDAEDQSNGLIMVSPNEQGEFAENDEALLKQLAAITSLATRRHEARSRVEQQAAESCDTLSIDELSAAAEPLRILLAEDNRVNQKLVIYILNKRNHVVETANNGREALERVARDNFDVVLMDVQMAVMDGFEATAAIRALQDQSKARVPIIAITAHAMKGDMEQCLAAGMDGYITKPIDAQKLISLVEQLGGKTKVQSANSDPQPINEPGPKQTPPASATEVFNLDEAVARCFRKYDIFQDMVGCLFDESDQLLEQMRYALDRGDAAEVGHAAHRLKGTVAYLAAPEAVAATQCVERMGLLHDLHGAAEAIDQLQQQIEILKEAVAPHRKVGNSV